jgi:DNA replication and repair protein RecF
MGHVGWLELLNFRCHPELSFEPEQGVNVLLGRNGAGKTSVLEAISYASGLRSFRHTPDASLIREGASEAILRVGLRSARGEVRVEISVPRIGRRRVQLNGKRPSSNAELARTFPTVSFLPDDLELIKGSPGIRRDFVDALASQLSPQSGASQKEFSRALRQRNTLLRQEGRAADQPTLSVWDERLAVSGSQVIRDRLAVIADLEPLLATGYRSVAGRGELSVRYRPSWGAPEAPTDVDRIHEALVETLEARRERDMDVRVTTAGPHRDEPWLELSGRPARSEASQGEQRSLALGLRLASYELLEERTGLTPVLLLDDVFSELDPGRSDGVMALMPRGQVFVTSAREDEVPVAGRRWTVNAGSIV